MVAIFVFRYASVAAQLEAFFSVDGGLGYSRQADLGSGKDMVAAFVGEYRSEVWETSSVYVRLSWAKLRQMTH